ncbi:hypothetical protein COV20_02440 [Candidatus Woesearchaeota archaeon CG10_big_fil_rev_8_21_14_0_10_45_16]|nr:MAG: hypothetical protein COV20_02440 [Candidatus Woesearchaeota archaeon CG10_big_fil_rev_8_21_14_0_10_45_16]
MSKGYHLKEGVIIVNRDITELDLFVKDFLKVLEKHSDYLIVSGFVSISTGRTRGTEDVDILVPKMDETRFANLFNDLKNNGFWCYQGDTAETTYAYVQDMLNIRFAKVGQVFPNMEFISIDNTKKTKSFELHHPQKIKVQDFEFKIPPIEFEILYKELVLGGEKDLADARHLRTFFSDILKEEKFKEYEPIVRLELQ